MRSSELLQIVADEEGYDDPLTMLEELLIESVVPSICRSCQTLGPGVEPDADRYLCEECGEHAVVSVVELAIEGGL